MRKVLKLLVVTACAAALCETMAGCDAVPGNYTKDNETHGETVYVYLPNGYLLAQGTPDGVYNSTYNDTVTVRINGKESKKNRSGTTKKQFKLNWRTLGMAGWSGVG